ncbi:MULTISPECIES: RNA polymerase sigma factor [unclassified Novosphingobium]|uniref:RNA polymerase sigma factor n=1 Tax=unclassified Novosphingobium TaxID=2644732 RepID=UPI00146DE2EE|nr:MULTISPECIES: RNA polymerase sigma factor [unclassified Novosphingobium]NMN06755.1 RNA polymerase sigma-70 factor (ECF subfamily) [Novosphingobium sp. SG919]NMN88794.1 RNA polymerase sigma-70 factor (ECF subfamily) [Novosphingobium sp. SG916]
MYQAQQSEGACAPATAIYEERQFVALYHEEAPKLRSFLRRRIWLEDDRDDLVQEAFTRLAASRSASAWSNPGAYLQGIVRHLLADRVRSWAKSQSLDPASCPIPQNVAGPDEAAELNQMRERYRVAIDGLPPRTKEVYLLHRVEELGYRQIAEQLSISIRTVEWHVAEAIVRIGKNIGNSNG